MKSLGLSPGAAAALTAWATLGTLVVLAVTLWFVFGQLKSALAQLDEARELRRSQLRPYVVIEFDLRKTIIEIVIRNLGVTPALNVRFDFDPPLASTFDDGGRAARADWAVFAQGIPLLAPGREIRAFFDQGPKRHSSALPDKHKVITSYEAQDGSAHGEILYLDLSPFWGMEHIEWRTVHDVAKELEEITKQLSAIAKGMP